MYLHIIVRLYDTVQRPSRHSGRHHQRICNLISRLWCYIKIFKLWGSFVWSIANIVTMQFFHTANSRTTYNAFKLRMTWIIKRSTHVQRVGWFMYYNVFTHDLFHESISSFVEKTPEKKNRFNGRINKWRKKTRRSFFIKHLKNSMKSKLYLVCTLGLS